MQRAAALAALVCLFACRAEPPHEPADPTDDALTAYDETAERLVSRFLERGQVVSRWADGTPHHVGDSLIWTGIALGALPCRLVGVVEDALIANIESHAGHVVRYMPLPDEYEGREASLDGALGLWNGLAHLAVRCGIAHYWAGAFGLHVDTVLESGEVYPGAANASVVPWFAVVLQQLACRAGSDACPSSADRLELGAAMSAWAYAVKQTKSAAYRIHLGYLALDTLQAAGAEIERERGMFCTATLGVGMPLVDHWCGRPGLEEWLAAFQWNAQEFALQRAPWESADGKEGLETPGLDRLVALVKLFGGGLK